MEPASFSESLILYMQTFSGFTAYSIIIGVLLICGFGVPIPEDITLITAGLLAGLGNISLPGAFIASFVGVMIGDATLFYLGRKFGYKVFKLPIFRSIFNERRIAMAHEKVLANSAFICFTARFLPGLRSPLFLTSGILGVRPIVFFSLDGFAALISVPLWIGLGWWFGNKIHEDPGSVDNLLAVAKEFNMYIIAGVGALIVLYLLYKRTRKITETASLDSQPKKMTDSSVAPGQTKLKHTKSISD